MIFNLLTEGSRYYTTAQSLGTGSALYDGDSPMRPLRILLPVVVFFSLVTVLGRRPGGIDHVAGLDGSLFEGRK